MHLIANTLLEKETLELDQIRELIEQGFLSEDGKAEGGEGVALEVGEPVIDNIGDVRVRIQGKSEDTDSTLPNLSKEVPNKPESEGNDESDDENKGGGTSLT